MPAITIELSLPQSERIKRRYQPYKQPSPTPYHDFFAQGEGFTLSLYKGEETEKLVIQGTKAEETESDIRRFLLVPNRPRTCPVPIDELGSDEVGTGDYFGPIVVVAAYLDNRGYRLAKKEGATDSKLLSDEQIKKIYDELKTKIDFSAVILSPAKYNEAHEKGYNMNAIKALLHDHAQRLLAGKFPEARRYLDQFCSPALFQKYVREAGIEPLPGIQMATKGESRYPAVALASLIARARFLEEMRKMGEEEGMAFPKGAGAPVDRFLKEYLRKKGPEALERVAKLNFRNFSARRGE